MKKQFVYLLAALIIVITGCQKESSFEQPATLSEGSLQSDINSDCLPKTVNGVYEVGEDLIGTTNNITVDINVTKTGTYDVRTDTINGIFFRGTGTVTTVGVNTITLRGSGTPFAAGTFNFMVNYDSTFCDVQVDVLPAGASSPATFTLVNGGTPANCASAVVGGTYAKDIAADVSNYVDVTVNVTTIGSYTLNASGGGLTFTKSGVFTTTGNQTVRIPASGIPTTIGANTITFSQPTGGCTFSINVAGPSVYSIDCPSVSINGVYAVGTPLGATNTVSVQVNVTAIGSYNISTVAGGMTFSKAGVFSATGTQTITLNGSGTPTTAGLNSFTLGTGGCNFNVTVVGPAVYTFSGAPGDCTVATVAGTYTAGTPLSASNTVTVQVNVTTVGAYLISTVAGGMTFSKAGIFSSTGIQNVVLTGSGTPASSGAVIFTVGTGGCTFTINVAQPTGTYQCKIDGVLTVFTDRAQADITDDFFAPPTPYFYLNGYTGPATGNTVPQFQIFITKNDNSAITAGTYNGNSFALPNGYRIEIDYTVQNPDLTVTIWNTSSTILPPSNPPFTIVVSSVTATRVTGTFSGTLTNTLQGGTLFKQITEGVFDLPIL